MKLAVLEGISGSSAVVLTIIKDPKAFIKSGHYSSDNIRKVLRSRNELKNPEHAGLYLVSVIQLKGRSIDKLTDDDVCCHCQDPLNEYYESNGASSVDVYVCIDQSTHGKSGYICPACAASLSVKADSGQTGQRHEAADMDQDDYDDELLEVNG